MEKELSAEAFEERVQRFIDFCDGFDEPPAAFNLRTVGLSADAVEQARAFENLSDAERQKLSKRERDKRQRKLDAVHRLDEYRTAFWLRQGLRNPRLASFATFNLRQEADSQNVFVNLSGVGDDAFD